VRLLPHPSLAVCVSCLLVDALRLCAGKDGVTDEGG